VLSARDQRRRPGSSGYRLGRPGVVVAALSGSSDPASRRFAGHARSQADRTVEPVPGQRTPVSLPFLRLRGFRLSWLRAISLDLWRKAWILGDEPKGS
jgi:hypothetical protein